MKKLLTLTAAILVLGAITAHAEDAATPATEAPAAMEQTTEAAPAAATETATEESTEMKKESFWSKLFGKKEATEEPAATAAGSEAKE